jgi:hypothetical protein
MEVYEDEGGVLMKRDCMTLDGDDGDDADRPRQRKKKGGDDDGKPADPRKRGRTTLEAVPTRTWKEIAKAIGRDPYGSFQPGDLVWINKNVRSLERGDLRKPGMVVSRTLYQYEVKSIFSNGDFAGDPHSIDETHAAGMEFATKWPKSASIPTYPEKSARMLPMKQFLTLPTRYEIKKYAYLWEYWTRANPAFQQDRGPAPDAADEPASSSASGKKGATKKTSTKKSNTAVISSVPVSVRESASATRLAPQSRVAPSLPPLVPLATGASKPRDVDFSRVDFLQPTMGRTSPAAAAASSSSSTAAAAAAAARSPAALSNRFPSTSRPGGEERSVVQEYMDSLRAYGLDGRAASSSLHGYSRKSDTGRR